MKVEQTCRASYECRDMQITLLGYCVQVFFGMSSCITAYAATILLVAFAIGEIIHDKTQAHISSFLATSVILIALFWMGAPHEIMTVTGFATVAPLYGLIMVNIGSIVKVRDMLSQ